MYWFSLRAGFVSTGKQEKERRQAVTRDGNIVEMVVVLIKRMKIYLRVGTDYLPLYFL